MIDVDGIIKEVDEKWLSKDKEKLEMLSNFFIEFGILDEDVNKEIKKIIKDGKNKTEIKERLGDVFHNIEVGSPLNGIGGRYILDKVINRIDNDNLTQLIDELCDDIINNDISKEEIRNKLETFCRTDIDTAMKDVSDWMLGTENQLTNLIGGKKTKTETYNINKVKEHLKSRVKTR